MDQILSSILSISTFAFIWVCIKYTLDIITNTEFEKKMLSLNDRFKKVLFTNIFISICLMLVILLSSKENMNLLITNSSLDMDLEIQWLILIFALVLINFIYVYIIYFINVVIDNCLSIKFDYYIIENNTEWKFIKTTSTNKFLFINTEEKLLLIDSLENKIITPRYNKKEYLTKTYLDHFKLLVCICICVAIFGLKAYMCSDNIFYKMHWLIIFTFSIFSLVYLVGNKVLIKFRNISV